VCVCVCSLFVIFSIKEGIFHGHMVVYMIEGIKNLNTTLPLSQS
jgi:hypothetical protein